MAAAVCVGWPPCREGGKWDGRGVFYQMLRPEFVRSYSTPLSSDVFTGWSMVRPKPFSHYLKLKLIIIINNNCLLI
jgi:hypothetical protein